MFLSDQTFYGLLLNLHSKKNTKWQKCTNSFAAEIADAATLTTTKGGIIGATVTGNKIIWLKVVKRQSYVRIETREGIALSEETTVMVFHTTD